MYAATIGSRRYSFGDLKTLLAKATPLRSGDQHAGLAAESGAAATSLPGLQRKAVRNASQRSLRWRI
jgi:ethanolamine ammonia-lyase large subunit